MIPFKEHIIEVSFNEKEFIGDLWVAISGSPFERSPQTGTVSLPIKDSNLKIGEKVWMHHLASGKNYLKQGKNIYTVKDNWILGIGELDSIKANNHIICKHAKQEHKDVRLVYKKDNNVHRQKLEVISVPDVLKSEYDKGDEILVYRNSDYPMMNVDLVFVSSQYVIYNETKKQLKNNYTIVEVPDLDGYEESSNGLLISKNYGKKAFTGNVFKSDKEDLPIGSWVAYHKRNGNSITIDGKSYSCVRYNEIYAIE